MTAPFAYDTVEYPSAALAQAHPGHLHAVSRMFGVAAAPVEECRYLEVGCGDGTHSIAAGLALPGATFIGVDLSAAAIERGKRVIAELGLSNVSLYATDLTRWDPPAGGFDYVVAHGLYAWVPHVVRDGLLALMGRSLRPNGIGYVSYNTYPGCYIRRMVWEILRYHTREVTDPSAKIHEARELIKFLAAGQPAKREDITAMYARELDHLLNEHDPRVLYHDDLGAFSEPLYFHEFMAHAKRFGLRFVAEAEPNAMESRAFPPAVAGVLNGLAERDPLMKEQYLDFLRLRRFRQTLLSVDGAEPRAGPDASVVASLAVSGKPKPTTETLDLSPGVAVTFTAERGAMAKTDLPLAKAALLELAIRWPGRVAFADLVRLAARRLDREPTEADAEQLCEFLAPVWMAELVALHGDLPHYVDTISERPIASPLARIQLRTGHFASTLLHASMRFDDEPSRRMVQLLDGTRTMEELVAEMAAAFPADKRPDPTALRAGLERNLERLAKGGLLVG
jgi:SAM-dependent methyltransferase